MYNELALYGGKNECARTDNVFFPISEVCDGTVSLIFLFLVQSCQKRIALVFFYRQIEAICF